ncbi:MAG: PTS sugar transporter subunit IIA [Spirochaetaceae bacterium]|jgi:mannitol/fructose-specific phosphotransferase system IIA component (Ntr-type)|nr:PTS sugar transporter subunit IIA [Spirochaetaceae bacterium]
MSLSDIFDKRSIKLNLESASKIDAFTELVEAVAAIHPELDRSTMLAAIQDREQKMNTSIAPGVAVPHGYYPGNGGIFGALGISPAGIEYGAPDNKPVHCLFLLIMGSASSEQHLRVLTRIASLIKSGGQELLQKAQTQEGIYDILSHI